MKKVCILTSEESFLNNYGAVLQGYALYTIIKKMGFYPQVVRYAGGMQPRFKDLPLARAIKISLGRNINKVKKTFKRSEEKSLNKKFKKEIILRTEYFTRFQDTYLEFYNKKRACWFELVENPPLADIYVCGSDQIWNPFFKNNRNDSGYFLDFAPKNKPRIAYAPSFGCGDLPIEAQTNIKELLSKFDHISVREESGKDIINKYASLDVPIVADPTLLLESKDWFSIEKEVPNMPEKYILVYRFSDNEKAKKKIDDISEQTGWPVYTMPLAIPALKDDYNKIFNAGPSEFIWLINHASLVCTDSFHASIFSIISKTPFVVFLRENYNGVKGNMNSRVYNLLKIADLKDNICSDENKVDIDKILNEDFFNSELNIANLRRFSIDWLENALK